MEPLLNRLRGRRNEPIHSIFNSIPKPVDKVKNGYDYIIRGGIIEKKNRSIHWSSYYVRSCLRLQIVSRSILSCDHSHLFNKIMIDYTISELIHLLLTSDCRMRKAEGEAFCNAQGSFCRLNCIYEQKKRLKNCPNALY